MALTRSKTWRLRALAVLGTGALLSSFFPSVSHAAPQLEMLVTVDSDGTESWDADDSAGNDSGPNNGIVRVNDTLNYRVQAGGNGGAVAFLGLGFVADKETDTATAHQTGLFALVVFPILVAVVCGVDAYSALGGNQGLPVADDLAAADAGVAAGSRSDFAAGNHAAGCFVVLAPYWSSRLLLPTKPRSLL